jgi:hypothetical protein
MLATTHEMRTVEVTLDDADGNPVMTLHVAMAVSVIVDHDYGADADGRRGVVREELLADPGCAYIHPRYLQHMRSDQVEEALRLAKEHLEEGR